ncbi:MAG TPA: hypothetical protein VK675_04525 [Candidatus Paceibacterota bacterium]|nr:hypothetical protein [Candidatus Paceibacterota bacterium]
MTITPKQIAALKYLIFIAKDGTELSKRILAFLIDRSEGLTKPVCLTLWADREGYTGDEIHAAAWEADAIWSCNGTTHLNEILFAMGSKLLPCSHYGDFDPARKKKFNSAGIFAGVPLSMVRNSKPEKRRESLREDMPTRYTFWLAKTYYSRKVTHIVTTREELEKIDLKKSGLYKDE